METLPSDFPKDVVCIFFCTYHYVKGHPTHKCLHSVNLGLPREIKVWVTRYPIRAVIYFPPLYPLQFFYSKMNDLEKNEVRYYMSQLLDI